MAEVVTGEAVVLEVPCARFPSRLLALALDLFIQVVLLFILFLIVGLAITNDGANEATTRFICSSARVPSRSPRSISRDCPASAKDSFRQSRWPQSSST